jgi:hypothetical protein
MAPISPRSALVLTRGLASRSDTISTCDLFVPKHLRPARWCRPVPGSRASVHRYGYRDSAPWLHTTLLSAEDISLQDALAPRRDRRFTGSACRPRVRL